MSRFAAAVGDMIAFGASIFSNLPVTMKMRKIEEIHRMSQNVVEGITVDGQAVAPAEAPLKLPRVIVFGDEKAGKSSTIERIAQNDIFPRNAAICTRMPTVLKLRPNKDYPTDEPVFILTIPVCKTRDGAVYNTGVDCTNFQTRDVEQIRSRIQAQMDAISSSGKGCESDQEITVELHQQSVLHIDLVDLPGLRQVAERTEQHIVEALEQCTKKYISAETGCILCVLNAMNPNIQTTASLRMFKEIQARNPVLAYSCVAVLTNTDRSYDKDWKDTFPPKDGPCHMVEEWLRQFDIDGEHGDNTADQLRSIFKGGFVALVNRSQSRLSVMKQTLEQASEYEMDWFAENISLGGGVKALKCVVPSKDAAEKTQYALTKLGQLKLGLPALVGKIDRMIRRFMSKEYIPGEIKKQEFEAQKIRQELLSLGVKPNLAQIRIEETVFSSGKEKKEVFSFQPQPAHLHYEIEDCQSTPTATASTSGPASDFAPFRYRLVPSTGKHERLTYEDVFQSATKKASTFLQQHIETLNFTSIVPKAAFEKYNQSKLRIQRAAAKLELERALVDSISKKDDVQQGSAIALDVIRGVLDGISMQFEADTAGDIQLARFESMKKLFLEEAKKDMLKSVPSFQKDAVAKMGTMLVHASGCNNLDAVHGTAANLHTMICGMLVESVIQSLLCPLLSPGSFEVGPQSPFLQRASAKLQKDVERFQRNEKVEIFVESSTHLTKRTNLEKSLDGIHNVIKEWNQMKIPDGDVPLLEIELAVAVESNPR